MSTENKKIKNATEVEYNGIKFRSKLERSAYILLEESGFTFDYEYASYNLLEGWYPMTPWYCRNKRGNGLTYQSNKKVRNWEYTPDFRVFTSGWCFFVEIKGMQNDLWPYKRKMFLKLLESMKNVAFFEVHSVKEMKECINIIKDYEDKICKNYEESV